MQPEPSGSPMPGSEPGTAVSRLVIQMVFTCPPWETPRLAVHRWDQGFAGCWAACPGSGTLALR